MSDLVERVASAIAMEIQTVTEIDVRAFEMTPEEHAALARAAIAICMEEAARVVRRMPSPSSEWMAEELLRALGGPANKIPAAIRALATAP